MANCPYCKKEMILEEEDQSLEISWFVCINCEIHVGIKEADKAYIEMIKDAD